MTQNEISSEEYYGMGDITSAITELEKLMKSQVKGSKAYDYYYGIYHTMCALGSTLCEVVTYKRECALIWKRMDILEKKFLLK